MSRERSACCCFVHLYERKGTSSASVSVHSVRIVVVAIDSCTSDLAFDCWASHALNALVRGNNFFWRNSIGLLYCE